MNKLLLGLCLVVLGCGRANVEGIVTGKDGKDGASGSSCTVTPYENGSQISCTDGTSTFVSNGINGQDGAEGPQGEPGVAGQQGQQGNGCTVEQVSGGAIVTCGTTTAVISNGTDGAPTGSEIIYAYDPCGDSPKVFNDEILFLGSKGNVYAYYEDNADNTPYNKQTRRISFLQPGNYRTTDSKTNYCSFTVLPSSNFPNLIVNEVQN